MAWQNENHYSKENDTRENKIPRGEIFKPADHVKCEGQGRSQRLLSLPFSRSAFMLSCYLQKTAINHWFFSV